MIKLRLLLSFIAVAFLAAGLFATVDIAPAQAAKTIAPTQTAKPTKTMQQLLVGKQPLSISKAQQKAVLAKKGGLAFSCNSVVCACVGDLDCNDMFTTNVCGPRAICIDNVCYCSRN